MARKPFDDTVAGNVLKYGTGGINIDGCRVQTSEVITNHSRGEESAISKGKYGDSAAQETHQTEGKKNGRFPANLILTHHPECVYLGIKKVKGTSTGNGNAEKGEESELIPLRRGSFTDRTDENGEEEIESWNCHPDCPIKMMDEQSGILKSGAMKKPYEYTNTGFSLGAPTGKTKQIHEASEGGASRFFYCAKASRSERNLGLDDFEKKDAPASGRSKPAEGRKNALGEARQNHHPTVKPVKLIQYLCRLINPKGGTVLDPFNGSGTTGIACKLEGFNYIGIELDPEYCKISEARIAAWEPEKEEKDNQLNLF